MAGGDLPHVRRSAIGTTEDGHTVERYVIGGPELEVAVLTWGASLHTMVTPDRDGVPADVVLGFDDLEGYSGAHPYLGATVGRFANRIAQGRFTLDGVELRTPVNQEPNTLHGGTRGFDRHLWSARELPDGVALSLVSPDGDMGFPGSLTVTVTYSVRGSLLLMGYEARTDVTTVVNLTNHAYLNLGGDGSGSIEDHELQIAADRFLPVDDAMIPTGELQQVAGTPMDFRTAKAIGRDLREGTEQLRNGAGYDHTWVLERAAEPAVRLVHPGSGRVLELRTDQPGVQFYSGNHLDGTLVGKGGRTYRQSDGLCLETQHFPDSPNQPDFPSTVLRPGEVFRTTTSWEFSTVATARA